MLTRLTVGMRSWAATVLVALYSLCVLAPAVPFAFGDGAKAAHCLTEDKGGLAHVHSKAHVHPDGTAHKHFDDGDEHSTSSQCCGLFCLSGLTPSNDLPVAHHDLLSVPSLNAIGLLGRGPDRLYRPPDSLLSL